MTPYQIDHIDELMKNHQEAKDAVAAATERLNEVEAKMIAFSKDLHDEAETLRGRVGELQTASNRLFSTVKRGSNGY